MKNIRTEFAHILQHFKTIEFLIGNDTFNTSFLENLSHVKRMLNECDRIINPVPIKKYKFLYFACDTKTWRESFKYYINEKDFSDTQNCPACTRNVYQMNHKWIEE